MRPTRILQAGDTYDVKCVCGWEALDCDDLESAGHLARLHEGDEHFDDEGLYVPVEETP